MGEEQSWRDECNAKESVKNREQVGNWIENIRGERKAMSDISSRDQIMY